jgi:hypothetical protein
MMIVGYPYGGAENVAFYGKGGEKLTLEIT